MDFILIRMNKSVLKRNDEAVEKANNVCNIYILKIKNPVSL
jgi:hypothetical protein